MSKNLQRWFLPTGILLWAILVFWMWSPRHYWPDADGYLLRVDQGRSVAHPPGYALFVLLGHLFRACGLAPYSAVQFASLTMTLAGLCVFYLLMRQLLGVLHAQALTLAAAFSWIVLLNVQTGTSHASDLFTVSLLLLAALRLPSTARDSWARDLLFAAALFLCAGFRLTTLLLMLPFWLLVALYNCQRISFWMSFLVGIIAIGLWQSWVIAESGGYAAYSEAAAAMNADNRPSSLLLSGLTQTTALNIIRALLWAGVGTLAFLVIAVASWCWPIPIAVRRAFFYGLAASLGPLLGVTLYLCTHPGYVVSVIPGAALLVAALASASRLSFPWRAFAVSIVGVLCIFLFMRPFVPATSKWQAVANGILFQYSAACTRSSTFNTTARWLRLAGLESEIPNHRVIDLQHEDDWRSYFNEVNPARRESGK